MSIDTSIHNAANAADRIMETLGPRVRSAEPGQAVFPFTELMLLAVAVKELTVAMDGIVALLKEEGIPKTPSDSRPAGGP